jgi:hypothetical protein
MRPTYRLHCILIWLLSVDDYRVSGDNRDPQDAALECSNSGENT